MAAVTEQLLDEGINLFVQAMNELLAGHREGPNRASG